MYAAIHYRNDEFPNESAVKASADFAKYKTEQENPVPKFSYYSQMMKNLKEILETEIKSLFI